MSQLLRNLLNRFPKIKNVVRKLFYRLPVITTVGCQKNEKLERQNAELERQKEKQNAELEIQRLRNDEISLLANCLTGRIYEDPPLKASGSEIYHPGAREFGMDWPSKAHTMIGWKRLQNLRILVESVLRDNIPGDFIETGVWRGGACIMIRAVLNAYGIKDRYVWLADSFEGLPPPNDEMYPADSGDQFHTYEDLAVSLEQVKSNFEKYGLLDDQVRFLKGWFKDTLPNAPIAQLALIRLDGDMYESTMEALNALYDRLSPGGYIIVDDYHVVAACKTAVQDFLSVRKLTPRIEEIDGVGVFWQKENI